MTWFSVLQYPVITLCTALAQTVTQGLHLYCLSSMKPQFSHIWVCLITARQTVKPESIKRLTNTTASSDHLPLDIDRRQRHPPILHEHESTHERTQTPTKIDGFQTHRRSCFLGKGKPSQNILQPSVSCYLKHPANSNKDPLPNPRRNKGLKSQQSPYIHRRNDGPRNNDHLRPNGPTLLLRLLRLPYKTI